MKPKNHLVYFTFYFLLSSAALFSQSQNDERENSPLMMFRLGEKKEDNRLPIDADPRNRTAVDDSSSQVSRGTVVGEREGGGAVSDPELATAQQAKQYWIAQKENAIREVQTSKSKLNPADQIAKAQQQKADFKNKAAGLLEAVSTAAPEKAEGLMMVASVYENAAEEAEQVEHLWTLRQKKNDVPWSHRTERDQAQTAIEKASEWAALDPAAKREKVLSTFPDNFLNHYQSADAALSEAQKAWEHQAASRWAVENQQEIIKQAAAILEQRKAEVDQINLEKTTAGRVAAAAEKITDVLQYVSINNVSPALLSKGIAIIADVINRRNEKAPIKEAARDLDDRAHIAEELNKIATSAEEAALEKESSARRAEKKARQDEVGIAIAAAEKLENFFDGAFLWKEEIDRVKKEAHGLQQEVHNNLEEQGKATRAARSLATGHQDIVKQLQREKAEQESGFQVANSSLKSIQDQIRDWKANDEAAERKLDELRGLERSRQQEVTSLNDMIHEIDQRLTEAQSTASTTDQHAAVLEKEYREQHKDAFDRDAAMVRNISRAEAHAIAHQVAYLRHWPEEAAHDGITAEGIAEAKVVADVQSHPAVLEAVFTTAVAAISIPTSPSLNEGETQEDEDSNNVPFVNSNAMNPDVRTAGELDLQLLAKIAKKMENQLQTAYKSFKDGKKSLEINPEDQLAEEEEDGLIGDVNQATETVVTPILLEQAIQEQENKTAAALAAYYQYEEELENNSAGGIAATGDTEEQADTSVIKEDLIANIRNAYIGIQRVYFYFEKCREAEAIQQQKQVHDKQHQKKTAGIAALIKSKKK